ncbi:MAG: hypothetical protein KDB26_06225, partial [Microthrixaceae bacterium]|nr:hypothetical protein [Microthrixaceae bacterium]
MIQTSPIPVVLVHWNQPGPCATTIETFLGSSLSVNVTVVDNGSDPVALAQLRGAAERINAKWTKQRATTAESGGPNVPTSGPKVRL